MIKLKNILLLLGTMLWFSSCDPYWHLGGRYDGDSDRGYTLSGRWFGDLGVYVDGQPARGTVLEFVPDDGTYLYGYGRETDYYYNWAGYLEALEYTFDWEVRDRSIYMYFRNPDLNCRISNYRLSPSYFEGYIDNYGTSTRFYLRNYDLYWPDYGYGPLYAPTRNMDNVTRSTGDSIPVCVRVFQQTSTAK